METKKERFDCVAFKREAQQRLMKEFEARRDEFATYADFINAKAEEGTRSQAWLKKFAMNRTRARA